MARIASIVLTTLSLFLGFYFFFIGFIKLSPLLNAPIHREMKKSFVRFAKVAPLLPQLGVKVSPKWYRISISYVEMIFGLLLAFGPGRIKALSNVILFGVTVGAIYTHWRLQDEIEKMYPAMCFMVASLARIILQQLVARRRQLESRHFEAKAAAEEYKERAQDVPLVDGGDENPLDDDPTLSQSDNPDSSIKEVSSSSDKQAQYQKRGVKRRKRTKENKNK